VPVASCLFVGPPGAPLLAVIACSVLRVVDYVVSLESLDVKTS
jgi:hypothetical protein